MKYYKHNYKHTLLSPNMIFFIYKVKLCHLSVLVIIFLSVSIYNPQSSMIILTIMHQTFIFIIIILINYDDDDIYSGGNKNDKNYFDSDDSYNFLCFSQSFRSFLYVLLLIFSPLLSYNGIPKKKI